MGNEKPQIEEQTIQWPKEKGQTNSLQNITQKAKDWAIRIPLKSGGDLRFSERLAIHMSYLISDMWLDEEPVHLCFINS